MWLEAIVPDSGYVVGGFLEELEGHRHLSGHVITTPISLDRMGNRD